VISLSNSCASVHNKPTFTVFTDGPNAEPAEPAEDIGAVLIAADRLQ
jgi:hypothetical protein